MHVFPPTWIHFAAMAAILAAAAWRGGREERLAAIYNLASNAARLALGAASDWNPAVQAGCGLVDGVFYLVVSLRSGRWWTLAAASIALINFATAVTIVVTPVGLWTSGVARLIWVYALNLVLMTGALTASPAPRRGRPSAEP